MAQALSMLPAVQLGLPRGLLPGARARCLSSNLGSDLVKYYVRKLLGRFRYEPNIDRSKHKPPLLKTPSLDGHRFLFFAGLHRSGTSVLHRLLRHHPATAGIHDAGVPEDEGQFLQTVFPTGRFFGASGHFAFSPGAHLTEASDLVSARNREKLLREWGAYYDLGKPVYLEKSPPNVIRSRFFQELFPESRFVFILRHPVAVAMATRKWAKSSPMELLMHWYLAHRILFDDLRFLRDYMVFRYEDFVLDPQLYCDEICRFAEIEPIGVAEQVKDHNAKYFSEWGGGFEGERYMLNEYLGDIVSFYRQLGYSIEEPYLSEIESGPFIARAGAAEIV